MPPGGSARIRRVAYVASDRTEELQQLALQERAELENHPPVQGTSVKDHSNNM